MTEGRIRSLTWKPPDGWLSWSPDDLQGARSDAAALAEGHALDALIAAVIEFQTVLTQQAPGTAGAALWVPDPATREPWATAALRLTSPEPGGRRSVDEMLHFALTGVTVPRGAKVLDIAALPTSTPAGDAVIQIVDTRPRMSRRVTREWAWYIQPPGTDETLLLQAQTDLVGFFDQVADLTADIVHTIAVELEPA